MNINYMVILINFLFTNFEFFEKLRIFFAGINEPYLTQLFWNNRVTSMFFNFVRVWLYKYFDMSVTDESYVDETRVWRTNL